MMSYGMHPNIFSDRTWKSCKINYSEHPPNKVLSTCQQSAGASVNSANCSKAINELTGCPSGPASVFPCYLNMVLDCSTLHILPLDTSFEQQQKKESVLFISGSQTLVNGKIT